MKRQAEALRVMNVPGPNVRHIVQPEALLKEMARQVDAKPGDRVFLSMQKVIK